MVFKSLVLVLLPLLVYGYDEEIEAMKFFKDSITEDPTDALVDWNFSSIHHCNWTGIECDHASGRVVSISLHGKKLKGEVSQFLGKLSSLKFLDLSRNSFTGDIPFQLQFCSQLKTISLHENSLSGPIPWELGKLQNLAVLHVEHNELTGTIPDSLGDCHSLIEVHIQENNLTGTIPTSLGLLKELQVLDLSHNQLSGSIPGEIGNILTLNYLNLSFNQLEGRVPKTGIFRDTSATDLHGNPSLCFPKETKLCTPKPLKSSAFKEKSPSNHSLQKTAAISGTVSCIAVILILTLALLIRRLVRKQKLLRDLESAELEHYTPRLNYKRFHRKELEDATGNFSKGNILGTSGLSTVYKGKLEDGRMIAVKNFNFKQHSTVSVRSFQREMETLGKLRHKNLLKVLGYSWESQRVKAVVLEYMENGNLDTFIHDSIIDRSRWGLSKRVDILVSVASGLAYLHSGYDFPIVHCDLKPSNILLDERWNAHISDFGMARIVEVHQQDGSCVSSASAFAGTIGYLAPEFSYMRRVTTKVDVFSFGIIMMESITGKRPTELTKQAGIKLTLPQLVDQALSDGINGQLMIVDPYLASSFRTNQVVIEQLLKLALRCTRKDPKHRPDMNEVMYFLSDITKKKSKH